MTEKEELIRLIGPTDVLPELGSWIRSLRQREGLTLAELASKSGVPSSTISRLERLGLASTDALFRVLFAVDQLDSFDDFLKGRQRVARFPKTLNDMTGDSVVEVKRVRHRKDRPCA